MIKTMAFVHAPGANGIQLRILLKKMKRFMKRMNFFPQEIWINPIPGTGMTKTKKEDSPLTLIIGWGLPENPFWKRWAYEIKTSPTIKIFIAVDLYERHGANGRVLTIPNGKVGGYWLHRSWQTKCKQFLKGHYVSHVAPYGMRRIPNKHVYSTGIAGIRGYKLVPGLSEEIEIVRLIYKLFVDHSYTLTEISNLLNAEGIKPPNKTQTWNSKKIKTLVQSAVYIGSNQYGACLKHDVFPALVDRSTFCAAQGKIYHKKI
jgi:Recombinase